MLSQHPFWMMCCRQYYDSIDLNLHEHIQSNCLQVKIHIYVCNFQIFQKGSLFEWLLYILIVIHIRISI